MDRLHAMEVFVTAAASGSFARAAARLRISQDRRFFGRRPAGGRLDARDPVVQQVVDGVADRLLIDRA